MNHVFKAKNYDSAERFGVYQAQARLTDKINPETILELSTGSGFMKRYWKSKGIKVFSLDIDEALEPDLVQDVSVPFELGQRFDLITCFQVLEHVDEKKLWKVFANIKAHGNKVVFSVPIQSWFFKLVLKFPLLRKDFELCLFNEKWKACVPYRKWMLGDEKHSVKWFGDLLKQSGFKIISCELPAIDPLHYYISCEAKT